jgi:hypothetical protein
MSSSVNRSLLRINKSIIHNIYNNKNKNKSSLLPLLSIQTKKFSGPLEPPDTRKPEDVEPEFYDARHWKWMMEVLEFEIQNYDPEYSIIPIDDLQYDLKFASKMYEWRSLVPNKYLTPEEQVDQGIIESIFSVTGYKMKAELDHRIIGGRGGVDTHESFYNDFYVYGPFGTEQNPVLIPSYNRFRYVSCMGGYDGQAEHEMCWLLIRQGPKHRCPLCGQIFQLWTTDSSHPDHPYHDPSRDYEKELLNMIHDHQDAFGGYFPHHYEHHGHGEHGGGGHGEHAHAEHGHGHGHEKKSHGH